MRAELLSITPRLTRLVSRGSIEPQVAWTAAVAVVVGVAGAVAAWVLSRLIGLLTNLFFYGRLDTHMVSPAHHHLGGWVIVLPAAGGLVVGLMARYGSRAIRGHGIPEAMERVLEHESRIPRRLIILKPVSSAIAIGSGGPFGAEGPIIATGSALGSWLGQLLPCTPDQRKALLAAGAAAGMSATFGTPLAAVLLAVELLVFEYRARTLVPIAVASVTAAVLRSAVVGTGPVFTMQPPIVTAPTVAWAVLAGAICGIAAVAVTWLVYAVEDGFEHGPVPWMWWPALGGLVVGVIGFIAPRTLGVGYDNIDDTLSGTLAGSALGIVCGLKFISWLIALSSGTSGGTLAPLLTFGGGIGAGLAMLAGRPNDAPILALVSMASLFAGASRAVLASIVFGFEATQQPASLLPLLAGGVAAYLVSSLLMPTTIMTEKIVRRGVTVPEGHGPHQPAVVALQDA